jgi:hypothetical protein
MHPIDRVIKLLKKEQKPYPKNGIYYRLDRAIKILQSIREEEHEQVMEAPRHNDRHRDSSNA